MISADPAATERRRARLSEYVQQYLLDGQDFLCPHRADCRASSKPDFAFREGIMSHLGRHFDLSRDGRPLRIMVVGQESGLPKGEEADSFSQHVTLEKRYQQIHDGAGLERRFYAAPGHPGRNPHMRGTTTALRLLLGLGLGTEHEQEFVHPSNGDPFHIFDGFALVNLLLCSTGPRGTSQGKPTPTMARRCRKHFEQTLRILEPTLVILQGAKVSQWAGAVWHHEVQHAPHLQSVELDGRSLLVCSFSHPSAHGAARWGIGPGAAYVTETLAPTLEHALDLLPTSP